MEHRLQEEMDRRRDLRCKDKIADTIMVGRVGLEMIKWGQEHSAMALVDRWKIRQGHKSHRYDSNAAGKTVD